jgi:hypothetical protein
LLKTIKNEEGGGSGQAQRIDRQAQGDRSVTKEQAEHITRGTRLYQEKQQQK